MVSVLAHERVATPGVTPGRWIYMLHGIYGAGRNWGSIARRVVRDLPDWGAVLVDLREHGESGGFEGPHTLEAAAADLAALVEVGPPSTALLGHSFGGKVALVYARRHATRAGLRQLWVVDSTPEAGGARGSAWEMLEVLRRLPGPFASRTAAVEALQAQGIELPVAQWVSSNLAREGESYRWRLDLDVMEELLRDFARTEAWDAVEDPPPGLVIHFVKAEGSSILTETAAARIEAAGRASGRVFLHRVAGGHWVNAENPEALLTLLVRELPSVS
ncbi:MAG TPA: alpha/beta fold hydrolase [Longimicrobiales bacterium]|nr:alpha/beta fold hydrolase [Longimicrobiales bacterium]